MKFLKIFDYVLLIFVAIPLITLSGYILHGLIYSLDLLYYFITPAFIKTILNSFILSSLSSIISMIFGVFIALGFYTFKSIRIRILYVLLLMISFVLQPIILLSIFQSLNVFVEMDTLWQSILIFVFHLNPFTGLAFIYIFSTLSSESIQSALDISSVKYVARWIIFPQLKQFLPLLFLLIFILVFIDQEVPSILGYRTYTEDLMAQMTLMESMDQIILSATPSYILVALLIILLNSVKKKYNRQEIAFNSSRQIQLPFKWLGIGIVFFHILYLSWILFILLLTSLNSKFIETVQDNISVVTASISFSFGAALCTLIVSFSLYHIIERQRGYFMKIFFIIILLFYLLSPHALISLILLKIYQWLGYFSIFGDHFLFFIGYIFILLPIAFFLLYLFRSRENDDSFLLFVPVRLFDKWMKIILPKMFLKWMLILFIVMIFSLNELSVSILLIPPGFETMVVKIYNLLHYGDKPTIAFLSLMQILLIMFCFPLLLWLNKKAYR